MQNMLKALVAAFIVALGAFTLNMVLYRYFGVDYKLGSKISLVIAGGLMIMVVRKYLRRPGEPGGKPEEQDGNPEEPK